MRRPLQRLCVVAILAAPFGAPPSAAAAVYTAASCNQTAVSTLINGPAHWAVAGDTIIIPAGTCTWTSQLTINKGITIQGAGAGSTTITNAAGATLFKVALSSVSETFRLSAMTIAGSGTHAGQYGVAWLVGTCSTVSTTIACSHIRLDHLRFTGWTYNTNFSAYLLGSDNVFGVIDHNTFSEGILININHSAYGGVGTNGDNSWAQADSIGTDNALYLEDNTFTAGNSHSITDTDNGGGRFVARFNTITNGNFQTHGTESPGRNRGGRQVELYNNTLTITGANMEDMLGLRSGTALVFNNAITSPIGQFRGEVALALYRVGQPFSPWGYCGSDLAPYDDKDGTIYASGTITSISKSGATLTVTDSTKSALTAYNNPGNTYFVVNTRLSGHPAAEITSATSNSVTSNDYGYWHGDEPTWSVGDSYQILRSTNCIDSPGMGGPGIYLSGATPSPTTFPNILRPVYEWGSTLNLGTPQNGWVYRNWNSKLVANKHFYMQNPSFNGTSGTGTGTLASRPATCTTGVGYWATDQGGNWNATNGSPNDGAFYVCTATNIWTLYYTPFIYPHPLNTGNVPGSAPAPPASVRIIR